ncbi:Uncharacterised protein [Mycobacteroides abscessus subsp. abscessus]|nr:Uncharacterised protein [Mycobacteroides abscessus subsp. abscessus]
MVALAGVTVLPALAYLFWLTQTDAWVREENSTDSDHARRD